MSQNIEIKSVFKIKNVGKNFFMSCWLKGPTNLIAFEISIICQRTIF